MAVLHNDPIPFITLPNWVKAATVCGFNIEPIFARYGVQTDLLNLEDATITVPQLGLVMDACVAASRQHHFPFMLGETFAFEYLPDIGTFLATSPTLRDAMKVFEWVRELINPMIRFRLDEEGDTAALVLVGGGPITAQDCYFIESIFASVTKFGRMLAGDLEQFSQLRFRYPAPAYADSYAPYFRLPVAFDQPSNSIELPRHRLDQHLEGSFVRLHEQAERKVGQLLAQMPRRTGLVAAMEAAFEQNTALFAEGIDGMSRVLDIHPRTLQRRLQGEGEAFGNVVDRVRYRLALKALEDGKLDLETISEQLGFSDRRSFTRAFTRWSGATPSSFRHRRDP